ncbi:ATP-binding protein [Vibrio sp. JC009]|uniref:ATP-binding protein n=1 Tax=Vibrio sp. JC009 TaxID=2912314 RepID=UPI0023B1C812|nr:ATP-binding protein [Vibrio sp. JC009]WED20831.1 ATP-binding protein [Vibrio sp. JC009]
MDQDKLDRLINHYFVETGRTMEVAEDKPLLTQGVANERLYYVLSGSFEGFFTDDEGMRSTKIFTAKEGAFIGVYSFFSEKTLSSSSVIAKEKSVVAWIDKETLPIEPEYYGNLTEQFAPVIILELSNRQMRTVREAIAKEEALQKLYTAEQMTTLGQLAAGIAHELNNAIGVVSSKTERLQLVISQLIQELHPEAMAFLEEGLNHGQVASSSEVRRRAKELESVHKLPRETAKSLARAVPEGELSPLWLNDVEEAIRFWGVGRDLRDMRLAAKHSVGIVRSVKQLGRTDIDTEEWLDVNESINKAISLLQSDLRRVSVHLSPASLPPFKGSSTELVQVWANIMKNACDAMERTPSPEIDISTRHTNNRILITITNNGPEIDEATRRKIFQPNFTTKKGGLSFGLGLGLSIVKRIISGYGGSIAVKSSAEKTIFRIKLPVEE